MTRKPLTAIVPLEHAKLNQTWAIQWDPKRPDFDLEKEIPRIIENKYKDLPGEYSVFVKGDHIVINWYPPATDNSTERLHNDALMLAKQGDYESALKKWLEVISVSPNDPEYQYNVGIAYFQVKRYEEASKHLQKALELCPIHFKAHLLLGTIYIKTGNFDLAENHINESLNLNSDNALAYLNLGAIHSVRKDYQKGLQMFQRAIELAPKEARAYLGIAKIYSMTGNVAKANEYFRKVIELDHNGPLSKYAKKAIVVTEETPATYQVKKGIVTDKYAEDCYSEGFRHFLSGKYNDAMSLYEKYLTLRPKDDYVWCALGEAQMRAGLTEKAIQSFKNALRNNPNRGLYYKELALALDKLGKAREVIELIKKARDLGKKDVVTLTLFGKNLVKEGKFRDAIVVLEQALQLDKNNLIARYNLALALIKNNELELALTHLEEIEASKQSSPLKKLARDLIKAHTHE